MKVIFRLFSWGLVGTLVTALALSCESLKPRPSEFGAPNRVVGNVVAKPESRQIVHFTDTTTEYRISRNELARAFIRQFHDGTVIDKVQVRKAPVAAGQSATYFLIGLGLRGGTFRAMALPLTGGGDKTYYLRPTAERYILSSVGCPACFFNFENGRIVGTSCAENSSGSHCDLKVEPNNALFPTGQ